MVFYKKAYLNRRAAFASLIAGGIAMIRQSNARQANIDRYVSPVDITADDISWFRLCRSVWIESEAGAPAVVPAELSLQALADFGDRGRPRAVYERLERVLCAFFLHGRFVSGLYPLNPRVVLSEAFAGAPDLAALNVSTDHVRLFRHTNWRSLFIDTKRPYGNSQGYEAEMAEILGLPAPSNGQARLPLVTEARMQTLHRDMLFVLQAYLQHAELVPGHYQIPFDGWETWILPRCKPIPQTRLEVYVQEMEQLRQQTFPNDPTKVGPRFKAAKHLFGADY
jgi:hypothetical protein